MGRLVRLVLVINVPRRTPGKCARDCMVMRVVTGDTADQRAPQTAFSGSRIGSDEGARQCDDQSKPWKAHPISPPTDVSGSNAASATTVRLNLGWENLDSRRQRLV